MHNPIERKTEGVRTEVKKLRPAEGKRGGEKKNQTTGRRPGPCFLREKHNFGGRGTLQEREMKTVQRIKRDKKQSRRATKVSA